MSDPILKFSLRLESVAQFSCQVPGMLVRVLSLRMSRLISIRVVVFLMTICMLQRCCMLKVWRCSRVADRFGNLGCEDKIVGVICFGLQAGRDSRRQVGFPFYRVCFTICCVGKFCFFG